MSLTLHDVVRSVNEADPNYQPPGGEPPMKPPATAAASRAPRLPRRFVDPQLVARALREQRAPATDHVTARPPVTPGLIAYSFLAHLPPRRDPV